MEIVIYMLGKKNIVVDPQFPTLQFFTLWKLSVIQKHRFLSSPFRIQPIEQTITVEQIS